ncbi:MAG TPA: hypothetical protein VGI10_30280 [Polyangiaceae bacterium]
MSGARAKGPMTTLIRCATVCSLLMSLACSSTPLIEPQGAPATFAGAGGAASGNGASQGGSGGSAPGSTWAAYPAGPYGTVVGATIENLSFLGWHDPVAAGYDPNAFELLQLSDFYDPDGASGVKLLAINVSAVWCAVCRAEYQDFKDNDVYETYRQKGVQMLGTLFEDNNYYPARPSDLVLWGSVSSHQVAFPLVLDPSFKMGAYFTSDATPLNMLVDTRSMKIVQATMGYSADYWTGVDTLLSKL